MMASPSAGGIHRHQQHHQQQHSHQSHRQSRTHDVSSGDADWGQQIRKIISIQPTTPRSKHFGDPRLGHRKIHQGRSCLPHTDLKLYGRRVPIARTTSILSSSFPIPYIYSGFVWLISVDSVMQSDMNSSRSPLDG